MQPPSDAAPKEMLSSLARRLGEWHTVGVSGGEILRKTPPSAKFYGSLSSGFTRMVIFVRWVIIPRISTA